MTNQNQASVIYFAREILKIPKSGREFMHLSSHLRLTAQGLLVVLVFLVYVLNFSPRKSNFSRIGLVFVSSAKIAEF